MSYVVGFAKGSNLLHAVHLPTTNQIVKDITIHPIGHEFERLTGAIAKLSDNDCPRLRCYDNGLKIQTGIRPANGFRSANSMLLSNYIIKIH